MTLHPIFKLLAAMPDSGSDARFPILTVPPEIFRDHAETCMREGARLSLMFAEDERASKGVYSVHAVFEMPEAGGLLLALRTELKDNKNPHYPSLTASIMAAHWYERQIMDQFGITPVGHPDLRRLMNHENTPEDTHPMRKDFAWDTKLARASVPYPMRAVSGGGVYEIPVGPIHAGIIEPGHFRFNVRGERIITLEAKLFFKHKGVQKIAEGKTPEEAMPFVERVSGDMPVAHALAFAEAVERARGADVPLRAKYLRSLYSELERITMHVFDIGNMGGMGTGFTFMAAQGFRLVEDLRRMHQEIIGHRFLRGAVSIGGATDISDEARTLILKTLKHIEKEMEHLSLIAFSTDGLMERFETTGILTKEAAEAYGAVGVAARASGIGRDLRVDRPYAAYADLDTKIVMEDAGDVAARFRVRVGELAESIRLVRDVLSRLPKGAVTADVSLGKGDAFGWAESWRGGILDFVRLDKEGRISRFVIRDPSFCNWPLFGELAPGNIVPDFPLCNKSLNLSYSGTDL